MSKTNHYQSVFFFILAALCTTPNILAANLQHGKDLHDANCLSCHASLMAGHPNQIYTRENRRVNSIDALRKQVSRCKTTVGVPWPDDQINDVVDYLNQKFYHIGQ